LPLGYRRPVKLSPRYDGPPILSVDGPPDDQAAPVARQRRRMESMLAGLDADGWSAPSRCEGWTVQDVISHLVGVNGFWETSVKAGIAGEPTRMLAAFDPAAHPALMVGAMAELTAAEVFDQFVASNAGFLGALASLDEAGWTKLAESPPGHVPIRLLAQHALWDAWIHERDIALPLGLVPEEEPDEVQSCLVYAAAIGPALAVLHDDAFRGELAVDADGPETRFTLVVGDSVAVHDGAAANVPSLRGAAVALTEALSVRAPLPADAPAEWRHLLKGLATVFDSPAELV
jgi:uncharacterized protein (TIGR03083 family)